MDRGRWQAGIIYLAITGFGGLFFSTAFTVAAVYRVRSAGLDPFQLVLLGTALEGAIFLCEIPTGVVADTISRRWSVITGYALIGSGLALEGAFASFLPILGAQAIWGLGYTFTSGAEAAWLADEVGEERAAGLYLRGAQFGQIGSFMGIGLAVALASVRLNLPLLAGGVGFVALAIVLIATMPETGFSPTPRGERTTWATLGGTLSEGVQTVRQRPGIGIIFIIAGIFGAASEALDRLWEVHLLQIGLPDAGALDPIVWFGLLESVALMLSIVAAEVVRRRAIAGDYRRTARALLVINTALLGTVVLFGLASDFAVAAGAYWGVVLLRRLNAPLSVAWLNQGLDPRSRATVLSMQSQSDAFGQVAGGPVLGAIASFTSIRLALVIAGLVLSPALWLYRRAGRQRLLPLEKSDAPLSSTSIQ